MKSQHWQKLFLNLICWLALEIILNLMGLDDLADYSEFIFNYDNVNLTENFKAQALDFRQGARVGNFFPYAFNASEENLILDFRAQLLTI